jgi:UDP-glucose 4-epimerase
MNISVLVIGGAGYIGSHMGKMLKGKGCRITVFDNLSRGFRDAVMTDDFVQGDLLNISDLRNLFQSRTFDVVMHFSALCYVGESAQCPLMYYRNNVEGTVNLLNVMKEARVDKFVFSSSCAVYGIPRAIPITEEQPKSPVNPYGWTKLFVEQILNDSVLAHGLRSISLRYFNAAGLDPEGVLGERHDPETHIIPLVLKEALRVQQGGKPEDTTLHIFGDDYGTPDGTCIRDYIHVQDLCDAHMAAMSHLLEDKSKGAEAFNLGNGRGFSVKEVIEACRRVTGVDIRYKIAERRPGDPPRLVGSAEKAIKVLKWQPKFTTIDEIIKTAWKWFAIQLFNGHVRLYDHPRS